MVDQSSAHGGVDVKTTQRLNQIASDPARRLVEYFVIVDSVERNSQQEDETSAFSEWRTDSFDEDEDDDDNNNENGESGGSDAHVLRNHKFRPSITARFPLHDHADNPLHENVTFFCHPAGSIHVRTTEMLPKVHFFVATGGTGKQIYGTCLTIWEPVMLKVKVKNKSGIKGAVDNNDDEVEEERRVFLPKCLVLLSTYPYLAAFREFLTQLYHLCKGEGYELMKLPLERHIINFCAEIPAPPPGSFEVQTTILDSVIKIWSPPNNLPITWVSIPFGYTFECLDIANIITVWHCLTLERQVLITSTQLSILTQTTEIFLSLLFPMRWSHAYIPILPTFLIPMLSAPMPFLCGINKANLADALYDLSRECVLVDLDKNTVTFGPETPPLPPLPPYQEAALRQQLEDNVGMIFREARSLTKNDDYSDSGAHLPSHVKIMAEAMWESRLCLFDEAFHLVFTPEEARKNILNGNDASGLELSDRDISNPLSMMNISSNDDAKNNAVTTRKQSQWDAVQEGFLDTFVYLLRNYRKYLVFPSKHNEGSYGGAGFRSKEFIESQRYDMRGFLEQLIGTQMFDNFITKRLYGSGEADVSFFDNAVDRFLKNAGMFADVDIGGRFLASSGATGSSLTSPANGGGVTSGGPNSVLSKQQASSTRNLLSNAARRNGAFFTKTATGTGGDPLWQSAKVHRMLKTIVPPEPTGEDLPDTINNIPELAVSGGGAEEDGGGDGDDTNSVHSGTSGTTRNSKNSTPSRRNYSSNSSSFGGAPTKARTFVYKEFPSSFHPELFGKPRPLPAAVIAEFDRQRKDAAQFRRKGQQRAGGGQGGNKLTKSHFRRAHATVDPEIPPSPEAATFTVFFMAFTALVGKELMQMAQESAATAATEKTILSTFVPTGSYESDTESEVLENGSTGGGGDQESTVDPAEKAGIAEMKADRPHMGGMFEEDSEDVTDNNHDGMVRQAGMTENTSMDAVDLQSVGSNDELAFGKGEAKAQTVSDKSNGKTTTTTAATSKDEEGTVNTSKTVGTNKSEESKPRKRFRDKLSDLQIEEAKATGRAQLGLAFEMLTMMKKRALQADPEAYQSLIDACGRVGDTKRATELLRKMHEDGIVADGTVYACLVSAFSAESAWKDKTQQEELPEWANSTAVEMDWNKLQKRTFLERMIGQVTADDDDDDDDPALENMTTYQKIRRRVLKARGKDSSGLNGVGGSSSKAEVAKMEFFVTEAVERQIALGENLLEIVFPDISVDTENEVCPRCNFFLDDDNVVGGWTPGDNNDYTTSCPNCTQRFVPHFCVQSSSPTFMGSKGPASPLLCERLSPWVLQKEIRSVMSDIDGIDSLLDPSWREKEYKNAVLWWNLVLSCMRYRLPFTFLLQGSFEQNLIAPMPEDEA